MDRSASAREKPGLESTKWMFSVNRQDIHYLRTTIESYDGMAVVRTVDPSQATIELLIAPGCEEMVSELIRCLREREGLPLKPITAQSTEHGA